MDRLLPFLGGITGAVKAQLKLANLSFLRVLVFIRQIHENASLLLGIEVRPSDVVYHQFASLSRVAIVMGRRM